MLFTRPVSHLKCWILLFRLLLFSEMIPDVELNMIWQLMSLIHHEKCHCLTENQVWFKEQRGTRENVCSYFKTLHWCGWFMLDAVELTVTIFKKSMLHIQTWKSLNEQSNLYLLSILYLMTNVAYTDTEK